MTDERAKKDDALSQEMRDIIREVIADSVPGDGAEMFDDWNKLAPHFCDYIIPDRPDDPEF